MKQFKLISLLVAALFLVACQQQPPAEITTESTSATETTTTETTTTTVDQSKVIPFTFYVHGEEIESFEVADAVGKTVFEAMASDKAIESTFDDEAGIFIDFFGHTNDAVNTWVYLLNDQVAELGTKTQELKEGDTIKWYFGTIDEIPVTIIPESTTTEAETTTSQE